MEQVDLASELPAFAVSDTFHSRVCPRCDRPLSVCLCSVLPFPSLDTKTTVVVLQHPHEARQRLATVPVLQKCLAACHVIRGRRFKRGGSALLDALLGLPREEAGGAKEDKGGKCACSREAQSDRHVLQRNGGSWPDSSRESTARRHKGCQVAERVWEGESGLREAFGEEATNDTVHEKEAHGREGWEDRESPGATGTAGCHRGSSGETGRRQKRPCLLLFPCPQAVDLAGWVEEWQGMRGARQEESGEGTWGSCCATPSRTEERAVPVNGFESEVVLRPHLEPPVDPEERRAGERREGLGETSCRRSWPANRACGRGLPSQGVSAVLVVLDGTWQHAREMMKASLPFLQDSTLPVCLPFDSLRSGAAPGETGLIVRKEPCAGFVSTMEAVARALRILETNGKEVEDRLLRVLGQMVAMQASHSPSVKSLD